MQTRLISALCMPVKEDETLDADALAVHLNDQWQNEIAAIGAMHSHFVPA